MKKNLLTMLLLGFSVIAFTQYSVNKKTLLDIGVVANGSNAVAAQPDGKTIIAGSVKEGASYKPALIRYLQNGSTDASFGNNGIDTFTISKLLPAYSFITFSALAIQADGKILAAGTAGYLSGTFFLSDVLIMRFKADGKIDSSFGTNGHTLTSITSSSGLSIDDAFDIKIQADGKIVLAGQSYDYTKHSMLATRYNSNGLPDNSFGTGGVVLTAAGTSDDEAFGLAIQADGKIVMAGESYQSGSSYRVALTRLLANGAVDNSFGTNGQVVTNLSSGADIAKDIAIQPDGKIVITGSVFNSTSAQTDMLCMRYLSNGNIDSTFGTTGKVYIDVSGKNDQANAVFIQSNGKILLGGNALNTDSVNVYCTTRLNADGTKDNFYGTGGMQTISFFGQGDIAAGMAVFSNGRFIQAGQSVAGASFFISMVKYKANGFADSSFSADGKNFTGIGSSDDAAYKMIKLPWDNSLLLAGTSNGYWVMAKFSRRSLALDSSFGINGIVSTTYQHPNDPAAEPDIAVDAKTGKIYLAGYAGKGGVTIIRFDKKGNIDKTFGSKGEVTYPLTIYYGGLAVQGDGKILIAGLRQSGTTGYYLAARINTNGSTDNSFGTNGEVQGLPLNVNSIQIKQGSSDILLAGRASVNFNGAVAVMALKANGIYDSSFGTNGLAMNVSASANAQTFFKYNITQDALSRIYVSGGVQGPNFKYWFSVTRFLSTGSVDKSFASSGLYMKDVSTSGYSDNYNEGISTFCTGGQCSVLTAGLKKNDFTEQTSTIAILLTDNGTMDSLNSSKGYIDTSFFGNSFEAGYAALADTVVQGRLVMFIAGTSYNGKSNDFYLTQMIKPLSATAANVHYAAAYKNTGINIYPNPAKNFINIKFQNGVPGSVVIKITDNTGRAVLQKSIYVNEKQQTLLMTLPPGLSGGVYYVSVLTGEAQHVTKIIIQ